MTDDDLTRRMAVEMSTMGGCEFHFSPASMLRAVALMQLASRHPQLSEDHHQFIVTFVEHARRFFAGCPTVLEVIRRGDDPRQDAPADPEVAEIVALYRAAAPEDRHHILELGRLLTDAVKRAQAQPRIEFQIGPVREQQLTSPERLTRARNVLTLTCPLCEWSARQQLDPNDEHLALKVTEFISRALLEHIDHAHAGANLPA